MQTGFSAAYGPAQAPLAADIAVVILIIVAGLASCRGAPARLLLLLLFFLCTSPATISACFMHSAGRHRTRHEKHQHEKLQVAQAGLQGCCGRSSIAHCLQGLTAAIICGASETELALHLRLWMSTPQLLGFCGDRCRLRCRPEQESGHCCARWYAVACKPCTDCS